MKLQLYFRKINKALPIKGYLVLSLILVVREFIVGFTLERLVRNERN